MLTRNLDHAIVARSAKGDVTTLNEIQSYWDRKNIPQIWYSKKTPLTLQWFNELRRMRYKVYYPYLLNDAEFKYHSGEKILEVGCGAGTDSIEFARNGACVTSVDLGEDQIAMTKLNFHLNKIEPEAILQANAEDLPFEDSTFDYVFSFGVLHHTTDTQKAINEIYRVLKPDGHATIMLYARGWKHYLKRCFIHGILKGRYIANGCSWQAVYNECSEVNGNSPMTRVYRRHHLKRLFSEFKDAEFIKRRMGEFFEYKPYQTTMLPKAITNITSVLNLESILGENWIIHAKKTEPIDSGSLKDVIFKHY
jgi:ubiquinone/menaquinone biosynthesis C-methylase UbiE